MRTLDIVAAAAVAFFIREILRTGRLHADKHQGRESLQTWEAEGGSVPVSRSKTAAQVSPPPDAVLSS